VQDQSLLNVLAPAVPFYQCREGNEVRLDSSIDSIKAIKGISIALIPHVLENFGSLANISTPDTAIDDGIKSDNVWLDILVRLRLYHQEINIEGLFDVESPTIRLYHCRVNHSVWLHRTLGYDLMKNSFSFVNLTIFDACIDQTTKCDVIIHFGFAHFILVLSKNFESCVEHSHLAISFYQNANLD
jgi:hypothetical protein